MWAAGAQEMPRLTFIELKLRPRPPRISSGTSSLIAVVSEDVITRRKKNTLGTHYVCQHGSESVGVRLSARRFLPQDFGESLESNVTNLASLVVFVESFLFVWLFYMCAFLMKNSL